MSDDIKVWFDTEADFHDNFRYFQFVLKP